MLLILLSAFAVDIAQAEEIQSKLGTIHGKVWFDHNRNGIHDPDEPTVANHAVVLMSIDENLPGAGVIMIHSQEDGSFAFADIEIGKYKIITEDGASTEVTLSRERSVAMMDLMFVGWQTYLPFTAH
jgi:hypothetical protein